MELVDEADPDRPLRTLARTASRALLVVAFSLLVGLFLLGFEGAARYALHPALGLGALQGLTLVECWALRRGGARAAVGWVLLASALVAPLVLLDVLFMSSGQAPWTAEGARHAEALLGRARRRPADLLTWWALLTALPTMAVGWRVDRGLTARFLVAGAAALALLAGLRLTLDGSMVLVTVLLGVVGSGALALGQAAGDRLERTWWRARHLRDARGPG